MPENGARAKNVQANPADTGGILWRKPTIAITRHKTTHQATAFAADRLSGGISVERSMLIWIGRTIQERYFAMTIPAGHSAQDFGFREDPRLPALTKR